MNKNNIFNSLKERLAFADQVSCGVGSVFESFTSSRFGTSVESQPYASAHHFGHGGANLELNDAKTGIFTEIDAVVFADGRIVVSAHLTKKHDDFLRHQIGRYEILFDPQVDAPEDVIARAVAATLSLPEDNICPMLANYIQAMMVDRSPIVEALNEPLI